MKARIQGVDAQMGKFNFFWGESLGHLILRHSDNLNRTLQHRNLSAAEGQNVAAMAVTTLESLRTEDNFKLFFDRVTSSAAELDIDEPCLPRQRKTPRRLNPGTGPAEFPRSVEDSYRPIYFEVLDFITTCVKDRFNQPGYKVNQKLEVVLLHAESGKPYESKMKFLLDFYGSDLDAMLLPTHLEIYHNNFPADVDVTLLPVLDFFKNCSATVLDLIYEVMKLVQLMLVMPATKASSERVFSGVRRIKTYLRTTMSQQRLNHLMLLHVQKSFTDQLSLVNVANDFITGRDHRQQVFGRKFVPSDLSA